MIKKYLLFFFLFSNILLFGVDNSFNSNKNLNTKENTSLKKSKSIKLHKQKSKTKNYSKSKSISRSKNISFTQIQQINTILKLLVAENLYKPFNKCRVLSAPKLLNDFGLSCVDSDGNVNEGKCSFLNNAAQNNYYLSQVLNRADILKIKQYIMCLALEGGIIAQEIKQKKGLTLKDPQILAIFGALNSTLKSKKTKCKLINKNTILCRNIVLVIGSSPVLEFANIDIFNARKNEFYGFTGKTDNSWNSNIKKNFSLSIALTKSKSVDLSKSILKNKELDIQLQQQSNHNLSLSQFLPKE